MLYLTTTAISWILIHMSSKAIYSRLKEEGYEFVPKKKTKAEERLEKTKARLIMLLPGINIIFAGFITFYFDKAYEIVKTSWIKEGKAVIKAKKEEKVEMDLKSNEMYQTRKYSELSNEEKLRMLELERAKLLKEKEKENSIKNECYNSRGAYTKNRYK